MTSVLPISNIINVSLTTTPSGLTEPNVNSVLLLATEPSTILEPFGIYVSAAQVADDYGTNSVAAQMANNIFAQTPNLLSGSGQLVIAPFTAGGTNATSGKAVTADISANLASLIATDDGDLQITVNGVDYNLTNLDFTACEDFEDIALIIAARLPEVIVTTTSTVFTFTSKKVGLDSTVDLDPVPSGTGTNLAAAGYFNAASATDTAGVNATGETVLEAIARLTDQVQFVGVITDKLLEDDAVIAISDGIQAQDRIFLHQFVSFQDVAPTTGVCSVIKDASQRKTRCLFYSVDQASANLMKAAYTGRAFSTNFEGSDTAQTMELKALVNVIPDPNMTQTRFDLIKVAGADPYVSFGGVPAVQSNGANDFFDNIYMDLALKFGLEVAGFNFLRQTNTKVPQTETGMNGLKNAYAQVLQRFVRNGCVAAGRWTSSETFGDPQTFRDNIDQFGYYIYSLPIALQNPTQRELRIAPLVQIGVKRAGAIHHSDVLVNVND